MQEKNRMKGSSEVTRVSHIVEFLTMREALGQQLSNEMRQVGIAVNNCQSTLPKGRASMTNLYG